MIDRLVHHAEVIALKGDSYRLKDRDLGRVPASRTDRGMTEQGSIFNRPALEGQFSGGVDKGEKTHYE
jgi:IstB-like ATP binding protein